MGTPLMTVQVRVHLANKNGMGASIDIDLPSEVRSYVQDILGLFDDGDTADVTRVSVVGSDDFVLMLTKEKEG